MKFLRIFLISLFLILPTYNSFADEEVIDPDLKLSIEELKKKYPIDWLKEKYGEVTESECDVGEDEPDLLEVDFWPCGPVCSNNKNLSCPKECYKNYKSKPENLVCSFFKHGYEKQADSFKERYVSKPVARFEDFSETEIKSAFIYYNFRSEAFCSVFKDDCYRSQQIMAISFIHFLNIEENLSEEEMSLNRFIFSKKINVRFNKKNSQIPNYSNCKSFVERLLDDSVSKEKSQGFCDQFLN
jgi:hypothetical protein